MLPRIFLPLCLIAMTTNVTLAADNADPYEKLSLTFTGGPYKEEVFNYRLMKPAKIEKGQKYPLVLFLHGAGERGDDNANQLKYFPAMMAKPEYREKYNCYVLAMQCREGKQWANKPWGDKNSTPMDSEASEQLQVAIQALQRAIKEEQVDTDRVYLTGLSMGGYGSWDLAARRPEWFAAVAPICGGGDERQAERLKSVPIWAVHGDKDGAVPVERSRKMIEAIKAVGGTPKYTEVKDGGHNVWDAAYADPEGLVPWMFAQKRMAKEKE